MIIKAKVFCPNCLSDNFIIHADTSGTLDIRCACCGQTLGFSTSNYITDTAKDSLSGDDTSEDDTTEGE